MKPPSTLLVEPKSCSSELPDILTNHEPQLKLNKSSDNLSEDYNSAGSGELDSETSKTDMKLDRNPKPNALMKSATVGSLTVNKVKRNFVIPPKEQRRGFGKEFVPAFNPPEPMPLLIIKRTPSKINLPPEVGKPKVALKTNIEGAKKYFGAVNKVPAKLKPILKRCETLDKNLVQKKLVKQVSLPEKQTENLDEKSFNFEPEDSDLNKVDSYIEDLLANKEELMKPIDPSKYKMSFESEEEAVSSSIEDLLKALETETKPDDAEILADKPDEKIDDLLQWMDSLDHQTQDRKVYRSYSDVKYKNLERILKAPKRADSVISKIPKDNISYFEKYMAGKKVEEAPQEDIGFKLARSKTDINFNRGRSSVDLDAVTNVDIKKVLKKFEMQSSQDDVNNVKENIPAKLGKRKSLSSFNCENPENSCKSSHLIDSVVARQEKLGETLSNLLKDIEDFVDNTIDKIEDTKPNKKYQIKNFCVTNIDNASTTLGYNQNSNSNDLDTPEVSKDGPPKKCIENVSENFKFLENIANEVSQPSRREDCTNKVTEKLEGKDKNRGPEIVLEKDDITRSAQVLQVEFKNKERCVSKVGGGQISVTKPSEKYPKTSKLPQGAIKKNSETLSRNERSNFEQNKKAVDSSRGIYNKKSVGEYENLKYFSDGCGKSKLCNPSQPESIKISQNKNKISGLSADATGPAKYSASVCVTETRIFPQVPETTVPESTNSRPKNLEALYAKVNKNRPKNTNIPSPLAPQRIKKLTNLTPQRPMRQKSFEGKSKEPNKLQPVAPQRKKSTTASPQLKRKNTPPKSAEAMINDTNAQISEKSDNINAENTPSSRDKNSKPTTTNNNNKDCCIQ